MMGQIATRIAAMRGCSLAQIVAEIARMEDGEPELFAVVETSAADPFNVWWQSWADKQAKKAAERAYRAAVKKGWRPEELLEFAARYIRDKPADRPWMHASTFLTGERWNDKPAAKLTGMDAARERLRQRVEDEQASNRGADPRQGAGRIQSGSGGPLPHQHRQLHIGSR